MQDECNDNYSAPYPTLTIPSSFGVKYSQANSTPNYDNDFFDPSKLSKRELIQAHLDLQVIIKDMHDTIDRINYEYIVQRDFTRDQSQSKTAEIDAYKNAIEIITKTTINELR